MNAAGFDFIERYQGATPWGRVLDARTGPASLGWISHLPTHSWTAVTNEGGWLPHLYEQFQSRIRSQDRLMAGHWTDPNLLQGEVFEVVVADFLLASLECSYRHFQEHIFRRLHRVVGSRLYVVGLEPHPDPPSSPASQMVLDIERMRDAALLLSRARPPRQYPLWWVKEKLEQSRFRVEDWGVFPLTYGVDFVQHELDLCRAAIAQIPDQVLAQTMMQTEGRLRQRALASAQQGLPVGQEYVVVATPI